MCPVGQGGQGGTLAVLEVVETLSRVGVGDELARLPLARGVGEGAWKQSIIDFDRSIMTKAYYSFICPWRGRRCLARRGVDARSDTLISMTQ